MSYNTCANKSTSNTRSVTAGNSRMNWTADQATQQNHSVITD